MDFLTSDTFVTIFFVVGSAIGVFLAVRADFGSRSDRVARGFNRFKDTDRAKDGFDEGTNGIEKSLRQRIDHVEKSLRQRIDRVEENFRKRIDRVEERARADHKEVVAAISELKTAVGILNVKLEERSSPRRLPIQDPPADYPVDDQSEGDPQTR